MGVKTANRVGISAYEFARREGVSDTLVRQAIKHGRLAAHADGSIDPTLVGTAWRKGNATAAGSSLQDTERPKGLAYAEALRLKENYLALLRRLEYEEKSGSLIEVAVAEAVMFDVFRAQRDAWMNWPMRIGPLLAGDLDVEVDRVTNALTAYVHKHISELGEPDADFSRT
ncbi:hypothetical protein B0G84_5726 [Paraburkholderia sp. BL8N3]|nr:hypothetical protein [Paraburkholderia sp. BL8N3]TCK36713.1 hypothetical protein B0G84_5726 [Paraburkholderia sp. BL8N3]